jgi:hypothetical protein
MSFNDENVEMTTQETIKLTNYGNSSAKFSWINTNSFKCFTIKPEEGLVGPLGACIECVVTYTPSNTIPITVTNNPTSSFLLSNSIAN